MYFANRQAAGRLLADQLVHKYRYENCAIVALNDGGVVVGAQIASRLHCVLMMLLFEGINLPGEPDFLAGISQSGDMSYNRKFSAGDIEESVSEFRNYLDGQKLEKLHKINSLIGGDGPIKRDLLHGQNIILVSDGLIDGFALDIAYDYLKPVKYSRLIVAAPLATVPAVDRVHVLADEAHILSVQEDLELGVDHYFDQPELPPHEGIVKIIEDIVLNWE